MHMPAIRHKQPDWSVACEPVALSACLRPNDADRMRRPPQDYKRQIQKRHAQCQNGFVCTSNNNGVCVRYNLQACTQSSQCGTGGTCTGGNCVCTTNAQCGAGFSCQAGGLCRVGEDILAVEQAVRRIAWGAAAGPELAETYPSSSPARASRQLASSGA